MAVPTTTIHLPVLNLIQYMFQTGDYSSSVLARSASRAQEGSKVHRLIQNSWGEKFKAEVHIKSTIDYEGLVFELTGRIDGVITTDEGITINEIKSTIDEPPELESETDQAHWAQVMVYAYMYCRQVSLQNILVQVTYCQVDSMKTSDFSKAKTFTELESFVYLLLKKYALWAKKIREWQTTRNQSIETFMFPFDFRPGQRLFSATTYRAIRDRKVLFAQAPTGTGKTLATLFPAIKALGQNLAGRIFYLTAKTMGRTVAEQSLDIMESKGIRLRRVTLTAKDKVCFSPSSKCEPDECPYCKGYYDKVKEALNAILAFDKIDRDRIEKISREFSICPFEFSLDISLWCDCVISDINYAFDPAVYLRRFFSKDSSIDGVFLVDEAHNLVDRSREMFSASLRKDQIQAVRKIVKNYYPDIHKKLSSVNAQFVKYSKRLTESESILSEKKPPESLCQAIRKCMKAIEEKLVRLNKGSSGAEELLELFFEMNAFVRTLELYDDHFISYGERIGKDFLIKLFCLDPSKLLQKAIKERAVSAVFFSATFSPLNYFSQILGGDSKSNHLSISSPFPTGNLCVMKNTQISTMYNSRHLSIEPISETLTILIDEKPGNYLVYFPSYEYLKRVYAHFTISVSQSVKVVIQQAGMDETARDSFLDEFTINNSQSVVGFAVLGGIFGEGIDLVGDRLIGAIVVGVGLPLICNERELIKKHFDSTIGKGFAYAYQFPGMNKVLQACGRVIRSENDRGIIVLIDSRYDRHEYKTLFPEHWKEIKQVRSVKEIRKSVNDFWTDAD